MNYALHLAVFFSVYAILAISLNLIIGLAGMFSLAHAAFFSIGAYAYAVLTVGFGFSFTAALLTGALIAMIVSLAISVPSWRLQNDYLLMITMAAQAAVFSGIYNWYSLDKPVGSLANVTNGPYGIMNVPSPAVFGLQSLPSTALVAVFCLVCVMVLVRLLFPSPWSRLLEAVRDDELAARNLGKNARVAKVQALALGCGLASVAGAIYAAYVSYVDPSLCSTEESVLVVAMVLLGGASSFWGPIAGAALLVALPEALRLLSLPQSAAANLRVLIFGALLVVMIHSRPQGFVGRRHAG